MKKKQTDTAAQHNQTQSPPANTSEYNLPVDVYETPAELVIVAALVGVELRDIHVSIQDNILTIKGSQNPDIEQGAHFLVKEFPWGPFSRSMILPSGYKTDEINANFKNSVLKISIPRLPNNSNVVQVQTEPASSHVTPPPPVAINTSETASPDPAPTTPPPTTQTPNTAAANPPSNNPSPDPTQAS